MILSLCFLCAVILAPYGLSADLVRLVTTDQKSSTELALEMEAWSTLYPLRSNYEFDVGLSATSETPFFVMGTPTHQNTRQPNKFMNEKKRCTDAIQDQSKDSGPKFVEVLISMFYCSD